MDHPSKKEELQAQIDEVVDIMRENIEKVIEREQKVKELNKISQVLNESGKQFEQQTHKLKKKYWWSNVKLMIILSIVFLIIFVVIIVIITYSMDDSKTVDDLPPTEVYGKLDDGKKKIVLSLGIPPVIP